MCGFAGFLRSEEGAIAIDWVAMAAGILLLGIAVINAVFNPGLISIHG